MAFEGFDRFTVVVNDAGQYSIWPCALAPVPGWTEVGVTGERADCLAHVRTVWTDMAP